jgi:hypothetical protein
MYKNVELSSRARSLQEFGCDVSLRDKEVVDTLWLRVAFQVFRVPANLAHAMQPTFHLTG